MDQARSNIDVVMPLKPSKRVLLVDDDVDLARSVRRVLTSAGFDVRIIHSGKDAVEATTTGVFDVIVSDIQMPGMSGVELLRVVRQHDLDIPVLLMTGQPSLETAVDAVELGALQYLIKPVPPDLLCKAVDRACQLHRFARLKREALRLRGESERQAGDRAGLQASFHRTMATLRVMFQPIVSARSGELLGYEALLRSGEPALPHPGAVLAAAERLERLPELRERVHQLALQAFEKAAPDTLLFLNLHPQDLLDTALYDRTSLLAARATRVVLEITERTSLEDIKDSQLRALQLRQMGFRLAVDDLGAGYAGLTSFAILEPEFVKLDMSLVRHVDSSPIRQRVIASMTSLCREMGLQTVAEGIETIEEYEWAQKLGCDFLQGYYVARPGEAFPPISGRL